MMNSKIPFCDPETGNPLELKGDFLVSPSGKKFPVVNNIPRFVPKENYAGNFGFQWNKFTRTQIDRSSNLDISRERFFTVSGWPEGGMTGENMLEVGSGAGRFSEVVLNHSKANLYSVDYSNAVDANLRNNGPHDRFTLAQASVYELPFPKAAFDKVFCFGVLQHTPDVKKSVFSLAEMVKPGGELAVDFYPIRGWYTKIHAKYIFRPFTKKMNHQRLLQWIENNIDWMLRLSDFFIRLKLDRFFNRFIPICDVKNTLPANLTPEQRREWAILDTFDMFSPEYDQPQRIATVEKWFKEAGLKVTFAGFINYHAAGFEAATVKGVKP